MHKVVQVSATNNVDFLSMNWMLAVWCYGFYDDTMVWFYVLHITVMSKTKYVSSASS